MGWPLAAKFQFGDKITTDSSRIPVWFGRVCGWYCNSQGRLGYAVEHDNVPGAIHVYPEHLLERMD